MDGAATRSVALTCPLEDEHEHADGDEVTMLREMLTSNLTPRDLALVNRLVSLEVLEEDSRQAAVADADYLRRLEPLTALVEDTMQTRIENLVDRIAHAYVDACRDAYAYDGISTVDALASYEPLSYEMPSWGDNYIRVSEVYLTDEQRAAVARLIDGMER